MKNSSKSKYWRLKIKSWPIIQLPSNKRDNILKRWNNYRKKRKATTLSKKSSNRNEFKSSLSRSWNSFPLYIPKEAPKNSSHRLNNSKSHFSPSFTWTTTYGRTCTTCWEAMANGEVEERCWLSPHSARLLKTRTALYNCSFPPSSFSSSPGILHRMRLSRFTGPERDGTFTKIHKHPYPRILCWV